jgi:hypothetical protein
MPVYRELPNADITLSGLLGEYDGVSAGAFQGFTKKQKSPWWKEWGVFAAGNDTLEVN